jgi:hypothetical protein
MEIINTFDEFEEKVLNLHRSLEYENWDRCSDFWKREYKKEMSDIAGAYVKGAEGDRVEAELRCKQINRVNLNSPYHFFCSEEEMARLIWAARAVTKSEIEKEIQAREKFRIKVQKEEEEARQLYFSKKKIKETQDDVVMKLIKKGGIVTDRRMPIILFGFGGATKNYKITEVSRRVNNQRVFTSQTLDILDAVSHKATEWWRDAIEKDSIPECFELNGIEEVFALSKEKFIETSEPDFATVIISDGEIRGFIKKNLSASQIKKSIKNIGRFTLEGEAPLLFKSGRWINLPLTGGFAEVWVASEEKRYHKYRSTRKLRGKYGEHKEENVYIIRFIGTWGLCYMLNLFNRKVRVFPPRFYSDLSADAKMLFRAICGKEDLEFTFINIIQIVKIFDWKAQTTKRNIYRRILRIESLFNELYKNGFLTNYQKYGKREKTYWKVQVRKNWFNPPRKLASNQG